MTTDKTEALLRAALDLTRYAAAPFFPAPFKPGKQKTTAEWWNGLREQIEQVQPRLEAALAASAGAVPDERAAFEAWYQRDAETPAHAEHMGSPDFHVDSFLAVYSLKTDFRVERTS